MKGKKKNKRKVGKIILLGMSFLLTIVLTATATLAWFFDSDWASKTVQMSGAVGIEIRDKRYELDGEGNPKLDDNGNPIPLTVADSLKGKSGDGNLHFLITTDKAYPGQAVDVSAQVYNNGGQSVVNNTGVGSPCYVRAHFAVYTNVGDTSNPNSVDNLLNANGLYDFLDGLVDSQNKLVNTGDATTNYYWYYHQESGAKPLSTSGVSDSDLLYYFDGKVYYDPLSPPDPIPTGATSLASVEGTLYDRGYFYLCYFPDNSKKYADIPDREVEGNENNAILKPLNVNNTAAFLWNSTFIIPWQLTNASADKYIFVAVTFQAIQTFIPKIGAEGGVGNGIINQDPNNQLPAGQCTVGSDSVQTVFNSSGFNPIITQATVDINYDGNVDATDNFATAGGYVCISTPQHKRS
ncbi:MAG: hypothetical protein E7345_04925 [Clostridiales bacterium]|nr:hypothetical protein [Clostridiales bacterium]